MVECKLIKNSKIIVKVSNLENYRSLLSLAAKNNINHTVFKLKDEVPLKVVIRIIIIIIYYHLTMSRLNS
jgi:hypothetical protein